MKSHGKSKAVLSAIIFEVILLQSSRFGEALRSVQDELNSKNFYAFNPSFDAKTFCAAPQPGAGQGNCCTR